MPRPSRALSLGLVAGLVLAGQDARALTYRPQTPSTVAAAAEQVVIATIESARRAVTPEGAEIDVLSLVVHETWRGPRSGRLALRQVRTVRDAQTGARAVIAGNPVLAPGGTYLLFLPAEVELPQVPATVAGENGAFQADRAPGGWSFRTLDGRKIVDVTPEGLVLDAPPDPRIVYPAGQAPRPPAAARRVDTRWRALVTRGAAR
ncbi:hypothetical protein L6V77_05350 [Myxococcota bacterium]|nr:hypothetical protein [Myxococcota bacterium]